MDKKFAEWLLNEIKQRGLSNRELARQANIAHTAITNITTYYRQPTWEFCYAISKPLEVDPVEVFRLAGLLPATPGRAVAQYALVNVTDPAIEPVARLVEKLLDELNRERFIAWLEFGDYLYQKQLAEQSPVTPAETAPPATPNDDIFNLVEKSISHLSSDERMRLLRMIVEPEPDPAEQAAPAASQTDQTEEPA